MQNYAFIDSQNLNLAIRRQGWVLDFRKFRKYLKDRFIVSGDGDFYCLVDYLEQQNKLAGLIIPNKYRYSAFLRRFSRFLIFLNGTREKLSKATKKAA